MIEIAMPEPRKDERPTAYADRMGQWYADSRSQEEKKASGQYLTPVEVADFMASLCRAREHQVRILDPGAGAGILSCALCESLASREQYPHRIELVAYETDQRLARYLEACLRYAQHWLSERGIDLDFRVSCQDFVLCHAYLLDLTPTLSEEPEHADTEFDIVISNPPYFKIPKSDPRAKAASAVVHGQPNIYALFMAVSAVLLCKSGELAFITPRSYTSGPYFRLFRERFFSMVLPAAMHLFQSRRDAFGRDEILQENVILLAVRQNKETSNTTVAVSVSNGIGDLKSVRKRFVPLSEVLEKQTVDVILHIPVEDEDEKIACRVRSWTGNLAAYGLVISTGPVVPFRATSLLVQEGALSSIHAPLIWMQHVTAMEVKWPLERLNKAQFICVSPDSMRLLVRNANYVLLRRFSSKEQASRLIAAPYLAESIATDYVGLENHLNYIYRPHGEVTADEACGLAALLNSTVLDSFFRIFNGSTQVSATELRAMPLPPLDLITQIGCRIRTEGMSIGIDALLAEALEMERQAIASEETDEQD